MGYRESYQYGLEVETSLDEALDNTSTHVRAYIVLDDSNLVFRSEWDNHNKTTTNLTGSNVVNREAEIMLQEVKHGLQPSDLLSLSYSYLTRIWQRYKE